uniref:Nuclear RNA export factor 7 n=1 Tax=Peromyscus maniculatus bairdii TaxID=230844 RepID=A0A8C8UG87_PERMB
EHKDGESHVLGRKRDRVSSPGYTSKRKGPYEHTGHMSLTSKSRADGGNVEMRDVLWDHSIRHTPYAVRRKSREDQHMEDKIHITVWRDGKPQKRELGRHTEEDGTLGGWFKVTPARMAWGTEQEARLSRAQQWPLNTCTSFPSPKFHCDKYRVQFFVQGASTAHALKDVSYKMCDEDGQKIPIFVNPSEVPYSVQNKFTGEKMEQLKRALRKRYNVSQHALDLQKLRFDPALLDHNIEMVLNRRSCMTATLQVIQEDYPELFSLNLSNNKLFRLDSLYDVVEKAPQVKILDLSENELRTVWELEKMKGLKLKELWLEGNPLCSTFPDHSAYVRYFTPADTSSLSRTPLPPGSLKDSLREEAGLRGPELFPGVVSPGMFLPSPLLLFLTQLTSTFSPSPFVSYLDKVFAWDSHQFSMAWIPEILI